MKKIIFFLFVGFYFRFRQMLRGEENPARVLKVVFHTARQTDVLSAMTEV